ERSERVVELVAVDGDHRAASEVLASGHVADASADRNALIREPQTGRQGPDILWLIGKHTKSVHCGQIVCDVGIAKVHEGKPGVVAEFKLEALIPRRASNVVIVEAWSRATTIAREG